MAHGIIDHCGRRSFFLLFCPWKVEVESSSRFLHFIPTYSSWLNQIECWFSILSRQALRGASFNSPQHLREAIDRFVEAYNKKAAPFEWKKTAVFPSAPKSKYSYL